MRRRPSRRRPGARLVSNPLILVATALLVAGLLGTVVHVGGVTVPPDLAV
jgi:hypothetical protein